MHNHLGPSGNYLSLFGPYLKDGRNTWGDLVNLDGEGSAEVRRYILDNVRMWFEDFHVDALRLDAVHALSDTSEVHLLEEMAIETAALSAHLRRPLTLIAESDLNDTRLVTPREAGGYGLDAQWSDDFHHAVHVALSGETAGYYADFEPLEALAKVCERGFFHDGTLSSFRDRNHGVPVDTEKMPTWRLVVANQNHDQIGNRARGDRLAEHLDDDQLACAALLTLAGPFTPMLFMGEEWAASTPFQFFTSHPEPELGRATAAGRITEFELMGWDPDEVPDPQDVATFRRSRLDWDEAATGRHAVVLDVLPPSRAAAARAAAAHRPLVRRRLLHGRGTPLHHAPRRPARRRQHRCGRSDPRRGGAPCALRDSGGGHAGGRSAGRSRPRRNLVGACDNFPVNVESSLVFGPERATATFQGEPHDHLHLTRPAPGRQLDRRSRARRRPMALATTTYAAPAKADAWTVTAKINETVAIGKETTLKVRGRVTPKAAGQKVVLQQRVRNKKTWKATGTAKIKSNGTYLLKDDPSSPGKRSYRVVKPASNGLAKGFSPTLEVEVYSWEKLA